MNKRNSNGMGSIGRRKDGRWEGRISFKQADGRSGRKTAYGRTEREVRDKMIRLLSDLQQGLPMLTNERSTISQYLTAWLATKSVRPATLRQYEVSIRVHLIPGLGGHRLTKLAPQDVRQWMSAKEETGISPTTIRLAHATLRSALSQAVIDGLVPRNVAKLAKPPAPAAYEAKYLTAPQARAFLGSLRGHRMEAFYSVALALGLRRGEALALSWKDIDFERGMLSVNATLQRLGGELVRSEPKTKGSRRTIVLPSALVTTLRTHRTRQLEERLQAGDQWTECEWEPVFATDRGTPIEPRNINRQLTKLLEKAELSHIRLHDCRHTAATLLLAQGVPVTVVSQILGHANPTITYNVYAKVLPSQQDEAAEKMGALLFG